ncbi:prephenate dehydratase [Thermocrinis minervae]|uniref:Bifunctional chorismate mutase/prephenate dehydratase n=1 Tax=Thermocrinis minervae TaxID=381751 RepID=A0A1M6T627_9AQUI|nr:prephenate dehydratase [Thermocrinis minervae]SHK52427.1 chorismate mutase / prephenate dehydratase [Thermocrinis minervae]
MESIKDLRAQIDKIDEEILRLLNERARIAKIIGEAKRKEGVHLHSPEREREVLERVIRLNKELYSEQIPSKAVAHIFREIMSMCLSLERNGGIRVAYLGPKATFTHQAALEYFGLSANYVMVNTIRDVFVEVETDRVDYGVVPVENTTEGVVNYTLDMFLEYNTKIVGEVVIPIKLNLLSTRLDLEGIRKVYSHGHALAQCRNWLEKNLPHATLIETESTAKACEIVLEQDDAAAIASEAAAYTYHLNILAQNIQDGSNNYTRFLVIGKREVKRTGKDKTSLLFAVKHQAGALYRALESFYVHGINLTKIESRPSKKKAWDYVFFADIEGHVEDEPVRKALSMLEDRTQMVKVLGSYPRALFEEG